jgi:hypothetical protein
VDKPNSGAKTLLHACLNVDYYHPAGSASIGEAGSIRGPRYAISDGHEAVVYPTVGSKNDKGDELVGGYGKACRSVGQVSTRRPREAGNVAEFQNDASADVRHDNDLVGQAHIIRLAVAVAGNAILVWGPLKGLRRRAASSRYQLARRTPGHTGEPDIAKHINIGKFSFAR